MKNVISLAKNTLETFNNHNNYMKQIKDYEAPQVEILDVLTNGGFCGSVGAGAEDFVVGDDFVW